MKTSIAAYGVFRSCGRIPMAISLAVTLVASGLLGAPPIFAQTEEIATFAADCTTPRTSFALGDRVCARVTGAPLQAQRRFDWVDPGGFVLNSALVTGDPDTIVFALPLSATSVTADVTVDNRGTWRVNDRDTSEGAVRARASFTVSDPNHVVADLSVFNLIPFDDSSVTIGSNITSKLFVTNQGPDNAAGVSLAAPVPADTSLVSVSQDFGPPFSCATASAVTTCAIATLDANTQARFSLVYSVGSAQPGTMIFSDAFVSSATGEREGADNSTTAFSTVVDSGSGPGGCTLVCSADISQPNDPDFAGALVSYAAPATSGTCGPVSCDPSSGSFFPVGSTGVACSTASGDSCHFTVTVQDTRPIRITLNGTDPMTVECHTPFVDPGVVALDPSGNPLSVTVSGTVDTNTPGTYTRTYTATAGTNTATATRVVTVVDTTEPEMAVIGTDPLVLQCGSSFSDPGATAQDACAGAVPVAASSNVDSQTPGVYAVEYSATDAGGNSAIIVRTVNVVDTLPPTLGCPANIVLTLPPGSSATSMGVSYPAPAATDACSVPTVASSPASGSFFSVGTTLVNATAMDASGNASACSFTVTVLYSFTGLFPPVGNPPAVNRVNAGRAIPVKFSLGGDKGLAIFGPDSPTSGAVACDFSAPPVEVTETLTAGGSSLSYDPSTDQYAYVWKTDAAWAGTCRQLELTLNDGTVRRANFSFR